MSDDIRRLLGTALGDDVPPSTMNTDDLEARGATAARRRGWGIAGGTTTVVASATAGILLLPGAFAGADPTPTRPDGTAAGGDPDVALATDPADQPEFPLPELDPDGVYIWQHTPVYPYEGAEPVSNSSTTGETEAMSDELWTWLADNFPDMRVPDDTLDPQDPADRPNFTRSEYSLQEAPEGYPYYGEWPGTNPFIGDSVPFYTLDDLNPGLGIGIPFQMTDDTDMIDGLNITVHPRGSFVEGTGDLDDPYYAAVDTPKLVSGCEDYVYSSQGVTNNNSVHFDCSEETGPAGEHIQRVGMTIDKGDTGDAVTMKANIVMVTLTNGNAVVVSDEIWVFGGETGGGPVIRDLTDYSPAMDFDALTRLALALPPVVVQ